MKPEAGSSKKINKISKLLVRVTKRKREKMHITNIRYKRWDITTNSTDIKKKK